MDPTNNSTGALFQINSDKEYKLCLQIDMILILNGAGLSRCFGCFVLEGSMIILMVNEDKEDDNDQIIVIIVILISNIEIKKI